MKLGNFFCLLSSVVVSSQLFALDGKVVMMKGDVTWLNSPAGEKKVAQGETVTAGAKIKTGDKSFAKIVLSDQTNLTIGPNGQIDVNTQPGSDNSLVNLVAGKLRASTPPGDKAGPPKLIIKTQKVSMGVRGTDLRADYNPANNMSTLMTFTGAVEMGKLPDNPNADGTEVFNSGALTVMVGAGQMSAESPTMPDIMQPVVLNPAQMESIKGNETFDDTGAGAGEESQKKFGSALPPGVDAGAFAADKKALGETLGVSMNQAAPITAANTTDGVMQGGFFSEKAGYIPPPADSRIDENTGLPIPPSGSGGLDASGDYVPPEGLKLMDNGQFVLAADAPTDMKVDDIPTAMGAPPTTELVTEAAFTQAVEEGKVNADGSVNAEPPPLPAAGGDGTGATGPGAGVDGAGPTTAAMPAGDLAVTTDFATDLASEIAQDIIQSTIDDITDSANTATATSGRSNVVISVDPIN